MVVIIAVALASGSWQRSFADDETVIPEIPELRPELMDEEIPAAATAADSLASPALARPTFGDPSIGVLDHHRQAVTPEDRDVLAGQDEPTDQVKVTPVAEPSSMALFSVGLLFLFFLARSRRGAAKR
jgi:hypothetical protein